MEMKVSVRMLLKKQIVVPNVSLEEGRRGARTTTERDRAGQGAERADEGQRRATSGTTISRRKPWINKLHTCECTPLAREGA